MSKQREKKPESVSFFEHENALMHKDLDNEERWS